MGWESGAAALGVVVFMVGAEGGAGCGWEAVLAVAVAEDSAGGVSGCVEPAAFCDWLGEAIVRLEVWCVESGSLSGDGGDGSGFDQVSS